jgi:hypothetical protein
MPPPSGELQRLIMMTDQRARVLHRWETNKSKLCLVAI